eukprot:UN05946
MGNQVVGATINWSELSKSAEQCALSNAKDILVRLNIDFTESENKENKDNDDEKKDNKYNNDLEKYLNDYLDALSDEDLTKLFVRFGVNPDFDKQTDQKDKIQALMLISSKNYWRKNWNLHPLQKRIKNWFFVHEKYRSAVAEIVKTASTDLETAKKLLLKFNKKLIGHVDFEENMLFKFMKDNLDQSILKQSVLNELCVDHTTEAEMTEKLMQCSELVEFEKIIPEYHNRNL